jgi:hypothetical protein
MSMHVDFDGSRPRSRIEFLDGAHDVARHGACSFEARVDRSSSSRGTLTSRSRGPRPARSREPERIKVALLYPQAPRRAAVDRALRNAGFAVATSAELSPDVDADVLVVEGQLAVSFGWLRANEPTPLPPHPIVIVSSSASLCDAVAPRVAATLLEPAAAEAIAATVASVAHGSVAPSSERASTHEAVTRVELSRRPVRPELAGIVERVAKALRVPMAIVSVVSGRTQTILAHHGVPQDLAGAHGGAEHFWSFCRDAIRDRGTVAVRDARDDPRVAASPLVGMNLVRAYAGAPVMVTGIGHVGSLCAIAPEERDFSDSDLAALEMAAMLIGSQLEAHGITSPRDDESTPSEDTCAIGTLLDGKYWITDELGEGGQGSVLLGRDKLLGNLVAIKVMQERPLAEHLLVREARALAKVRHPNLVTLYSWGRTADGRMYMVLDYVRGETLGDRMRAKPDGEAVPFVLKTLRELGGALASLHAAGLVHGDIKPTNVMYDVALDRVVLIDLGLGMRIEPGGSMPGFGGGTAGYSAPEQLVSENVRPNADVYALAATAYAMLAGRGPFDAFPARERVGAQMRDELELLAKRRPELPPGVDQLLATALAYEPERRRPATILDFVEGMERALQGLPLRGSGAPDALPKTVGRSFGFYRATVAALDGAEREAACVAAMPEPMRQIVERAGAGDDDAWYDADALLAYWDAVLGGDVGKAERLGRAVMHAAIPPLLAAIHVSRTLSTVLHVLPDLVRRQHDWLDVEVVPEGSGTRILLHMPKRFAPTMCTMCRCAAETLSEATGEHVEIDERRCLGRGDDACELVVRSYPVG